MNKIIILKPSYYNEPLKFRGAQLRIEVSEHNLFGYFWFYSDVYGGDMFDIYVGPLKI